MPFEATRRAVVAGALASAVMAPASRAASSGGALLYAGVNLAGAEFGKVPGAYDTDYAYPAPATVDYFAQLGFNLIRLPFCWERLQPALNAPFAPVELRRLTSLVDYAARKGLHVVLDIHNFARRRVAGDGWSAEHLIGSAAVPAAAYADYCARLAEVFKDNASVIFGLMNEPWGLSPGDWLAIANRGIAAIRSAGAGQLILVPGVAYSGAHSWIGEGNAVMSKAFDPARNIAFEVHQYFDEDSAGTSPMAMGRRIGSERIEEFQQWARASGVRAFLAEFAAGDNEVGLQALDDICRTLEANADVWLGWASWAGGGGWPDDYFFSLDPTIDGRIRPQTKLLAGYARKIGGQPPTPAKE